MLSSKIVLLALREDEMSSPALETCPQCFGAVMEARRVCYPGLCRKILRLQQRQLRGHPLFLFSESDSKAD